METNAILGQRRHRELSTMILKSSKPGFFFMLPFNADQLPQLENKVFCSSPEPQVEAGMLQFPLLMQYCYGVILNLS